MKLAPSLVLVSLVSLSALDARAADASVVAAQKALEKARTSLAAAVKKIEADPPATADLDAAHAAVEVLKDAIDAGAAREADDLDYAKAALAARKELRTQREFVDARRAKVHIFNHRRDIDAALAGLDAKARRVADQDPSPQDFDDARAAAKALKAEVEKARQFTKQDAAFATYLTGVDATVARQEKAVDERWVALSSDKHRALVEEARQALTAAMAVLNKTATDAQFKTADDAVNLLTKRLDEGKPLEVADKNYRPYAEKARAEAVAAKKRMDEQWSATGLERLKAEIEPAFKDLKAAAKVVHGRKPTADQLAEARTVAIVVRKLVEKFQPEAARSEAFGQYVAQVKESLREVEAQLEIRSLDAARAEVTQALRPLEKRAPKDDQFAVANSAVLILEKTLETVHAKDPVMGPYVFDAKAQIRDAKAAIAKRRIEVDVEAQRAKVEEARNGALKEITAIQQANIEKDRLQEAENAVNQLKLVLEAGAALTKKDREYAAYDREIKKRIDELKGKIASRRLALVASDGRAKLSELLATAKSKLDTARQPPATDADLEAATKALEAAGQAIDGAVALEAQDRGYAAAAERARDTFFRMQETLEIARQARDLRKRTGEAFAAGATAAEAAAASQDLRTQKTQYEKALGHFKACKDEGTSALQGNPALAPTVVLLEGRNARPGEVIALCGQRAEATTLLIKPLVGLIAFEEGPKRAFEKAKALLAQNKKTDALAQYDECTATGLTLQYRNPELKERAFEVAGVNTTLNELVKQCSAQGKALRGK